GTRGVCRAFGLTVKEGAGAAARALADRRALATLVAGLRAAEREALGSLLDADGVMLTRALETRFGDSVEDGFDWHREPPTSVLGRLRGWGLCFVGRATLGPNLRSRPRVVVVPRDLRRLLGQVHRATPIPFVADRRVGEDAVETCAEVNDVEAETIRFERAQPELAGFCVGMAAGMGGGGGGGAGVCFPARRAGGVGGAGARCSRPRPGGACRACGGGISSARAGRRAGTSTRWSGCTRASSSGGGTPTTPPRPAPPRTPPPPTARPPRAQGTTSGRSTPAAPAR